MSRPNLGRYMKLTIIIGVKTHEQLREKTNLSEIFLDRHLSGVQIDSARFKTRTNHFARD